MSINLKGQGFVFAKLGKKLIFCDTNDKNGLKQIMAPKGEMFHQVPDPDKREILYISGPSGSGKSTLSNSYALNYHNIFPSNSIFLFSKVSDDPAFDAIHDIVTQIVPDDFEHNESDVMDINRYENSLCIFDDIDQMNKRLKEKMTFLRDQMLEVGRHLKTYVITTSHILTNYRQSRTIINEATSVTFFPGATWHHTRRYLKEYLGLIPNQLADIKECGSRWVTVFPHYPCIILTENKVYIP